VLLLQLRALPRARGNGSKGEGLVSSTGSQEGVRWVVACRCHLVPLLGVLYVCCVEV
jgi:hypothetical protein